MACHAEGENWELFGGFDVELQNIPCADKGSMIFRPKNVWDFKFKKFGEHITGKRPEMFIWNILTGKPYGSRVGEREFRNHTTGDYATFNNINFKHNPEKAEGSFEGKIYNAQDEIIYEIFGNNYDSMIIKNTKTNEEEEIWKVPSLIPKAAQQYYLNEIGVLANHLTDDMKSQLPPTDSRFRKDLRLHEQGKHRGADFEKVRIMTLEEARIKERKNLK